MPYRLQRKRAFLGDELSLEIQHQLCTVLPAAEPCLFCPVVTVTHRAQTGREIILTCHVAQAKRDQKLLINCSLQLRLYGDVFVPSNFSDGAYI